MAPEVENDGIDVPTLVLSVISESDLSTDLDVSTEEEGRDAISKDDQISNLMVSTGTQLSLPNSVEQDQIVLTCQQYEAGNVHHSQTQTLHFNPGKDVTITTAAQGIELVRECCIENCNTRSDLPDSPPLYLVDLGTVDKEILFETLNVRNEYMEDDVVLHICNYHFIDAIVADSTKPVRRKRTIDQVLAEEAEKINNTLLSDRPKRKPKPSRVLLESDFAVGIHVKEEPVDFPTDEETEDTSFSLGEKKVVKRRKKKSLFFSHIVDKENVRPSEDEEEEYGVNISETSIPRNPPPRSKGRPPLIKDTGCQTNQVTLRTPLRDVNIQCNAVNTSGNSTCVNCSSIDWKKLQGYLQTCVFNIEGPPCDPIAVGCIKKTLSNISQMSHALNVLKLLCGEEPEEVKPLDFYKNPQLDGDVEVFTSEHPAEERIGDEEKLREIVPGEWRRKVLLEETDEDEEDEDEDDLFKEIEVEAEDPDDEEYDPGAADDEDWDIKKEIEDMTVAPKKRGPGRPLKRQKGQNYSKSDLYKPSVRRGRPRKDEGGQQAIKEIIQGVSISEDVSGDFQDAEGDQVVIYTCQDCDETFTSQRKLERHRSLRHMLKVNGKFACDECGKTFTQRQAVRYHKVWKHGAERKGPCPHCNYKAPDATKLRTHIKMVHKGFVPYRCRYCGKAFKCHTNHKAHEAKHTGTGDFQCQQCFKKFVIASALKKHEESHAGIRPFSCSICRKAFKTKPHLERHEKSIHYNEKKCICEICGAAHYSNWNLKIHMKSHEAPKDGEPKVCLVCNSSFRTSAGLGLHVRKQHGVVRPYTQGSGGSTTHSVGPITAESGMRVPRRVGGSRQPSGSLSKKDNSTSSRRSSIVDSNNYTIVVTRSDLSRVPHTMIVKEESVKVEQPMIVHAYSSPDHVPTLVEGEEHLQDHQTIIVNEEMMVTGSQEVIYHEVDDNWEEVVHDNEESIELYSCGTCLEVFKVEKAMHEHLQTHGEYT